MLPIPTIDYIPKIFKDRATAETISFTDKMDDDILAWFEDIVNLQQLTDVDSCPSEYLVPLGALVSAGIITVDSDRTKRQKIYTAIETHKKRGSWINHAKIVIDAITGYNAVRFVNQESDDWILTGDGVVEVGTSWAILGGDGADPYGMSLIGNGSELEIWGNIYIDCHLGIYTAVLTADQIAQIVVSISLDIVPAYAIVYLGYCPVTGGFTVYTGGTIV